MCGLWSWCMAVACGRSMWVFGRVVVWSRGRVVAWSRMPMPNACEDVCVVQLHVSRSPPNIPYLSVSPVCQALAEVCGCVSMNIGRGTGRHQQRGLSSE